MACADERGAPRAPSVSGRARSGLLSVLGAPKGRAEGQAS